MRKFVALVFAAGALALPVAPPAGAGSLGTILFGRPLEPGLLVIVMRPSYHDDQDRIPLIYRYPSPETVARAQNEIASNPALREALERRNIQPQNVVAVQTAASGGKIIYAR
ncbi:MAG: hypothetical protein AAAC47_23655 [Pararhizobium sp.]